MMNNWIVVTFHFIGFVALDLNINQIMKVHLFQLKTPFTSEICSYLRQ